MNTKWLEVRDRLLNDLDIDMPVLLQGEIESYEQPMSVIWRNLVVLHGLGAFHISPETAFTNIYRNCPAKIDQTMNLFPNLDVDKKEHFVIYKILEMSLGLFQKPTVTHARKYVLFWTTLKKRCQT